MDSRTVGLALIVLAVFGLVAVQLTVKARLDVHGAAPLSPGELIGYVLGLLADWKIWIAGAVLIAAAACWYIGLSRVPLPLAYSISALSYPLVLVGSLLFLGGISSWPLVAGNVLIVAGIVLVATAT